MVDGLIDSLREEGQDGKDAAETLFVFAATSAR